MQNILVVVNKHNTARVASCWFTIYCRESEVDLVISDYSYNEFVYFYVSMKDPFKPCELSYIQGVSRLQGITAGGDFLGLCDEKSS